ncbi:DUF1768 domain-containing protein [Meloidogyne graminicola]|uniref:DUF1768 domain-containing protein n=1 Tax=Meloidogyne graminicola TaxID=189291 RepID=A0A8T0A231_9BILA|nr:DUF1768 domain-containing protein [Meloidogyne graminicola]
MSTDDILFAFPLKQEIVEEIKPKIKISNKLTLSAIKPKLEVIEAELKPLIHPNILSRSRQETEILENSNNKNKDTSTQNNVNLSDENDDLDTDYRQLDDYISTIPLPPEPVQYPSIPLHILYSFIPDPPPRESTPPIEEPIVTTSENDNSFQSPQRTLGSLELSVPTSSSLIENDSNTPLTSQTEQFPMRKNFQSSINEPVTSQIETPFRPGLRQNPQRVHERQDEFQQSLDFNSLNKRPRISYPINETTNSITKSNNSSNSIVYPSKDSANSFTSKSSPLNYSFFNQKNSFSFSSTSSQQQSPFSFKRDNNNFNLSKTSSLSNGRFSFYTPKFNPLRYKNGWLFRTLCEKPGLKNPTIKSPIKATLNNSNENNNSNNNEEEEEGQRNYLILNENIDLHSNRIVPVIFSFNLSPIAPFFTNAYCFSNHYMVNYLKIDGILFCCTEQYYMFYKARVFNDKQAMSEIMRTRDPKHMKRIGSKIVGFDQSKWFKISIQVMAIATYYKYSLNRDLRLQLFETCGAEIIETNPTDQRWGIGLPMDDWRIRDKSEWKGLNILGRMLTICRDKLIENPKFSYDKDLFIKNIKESMDAANSVGCLQIGREY